MKRHDISARGKCRFVIAFLLILTMIMSAFSLSACDLFLNTQETVPSQTEPETEPVTEPPSESPTEDLLSAGLYLPAEVEDDGSDGVYDSEYYIWNRQAFPLFYAGESNAKSYAKLMNTAAEKLGSDITVYSLIAPMHTEFGLPLRLLSGDSAITTESQADFMKAAYSAMDSAVIPVNPYNLLSLHCDEYLYFASDHHWTALGAYYAYTAFAQKAGLPVLQLEDCNEKSVEGFTGSIMKVVSAELDTDTVFYWEFPYQVTDTITGESGDVFEYDSCYYESISPGNDVYCIFLMGDNPLEVIRSESENAQNKKIAVVHESYGNAFIPYLTDDYKEIYSIDFRYFDGDLSDFCQENGICDVLFLTSSMFSATQSVLDQIEGKL